MNQEKYNEIYRAVCARVEALGYECAGFEAVSENGMNIVRVYLEMPGGIDTGDCEIVSRDVGEYLDTVEEDLPDRYFLEISSPGVERPLFVIEDYRRFAGNEVEISLKKGGKKIRGVIAGTQYQRRKNNSSHRKGSDWKNAAWQRFQKSSETDRRGEGAFRGDDSLEP